MQFPTHIIGSSLCTELLVFTRRASPAQAPVAQLVEHLPCKELVPGSNPGGGYRNISSMADVEGRALCPGSIPGVPTTPPEVDLAQSITTDGRLRNNV